MMRVLLVNPPIYDFTAYDFWLRPYGLFRVAGRIAHCCSLCFFDFLVSRPRDAWGRGPYDSRAAAKPGAYADIPRRFRRYGRPRGEFRAYLAGQAPFDAVLIQTMMTYWYPGVREVIEDVRELAPRASIILGGVYATLVPDHARGLGADLVVRGSDLDPLWRRLSVEPRDGPPFQAPSRQGFGAMKITEGCPFRCSYCAAPLFWPEFTARPTDACLEEFRRLAGAGIRNIALYDDALLFRPGQGLLPFLEGVLGEGVPVALHTPNALHARLLTADLARRMVRGGFASFFIGLDSSAPAWQRATGGKVDAGDFIAAVGHLRRAGARSITAYVLAGHPDSDAGETEESIRFAHRHGARVLLSEFSPIPGTADGEKSRPWADLDEPLAHNKTAFVIRRLGDGGTDRLKRLARALNERLPGPSSPAAAGGVTGPRVCGSSPGASGGGAPRRTSRPETAGPGPGPGRRR